MKQLIKDRVKEVQKGLYIMEMDDFDKMICRVVGSWGIALRFPKDQNGNLIYRQKQRDLNNSDLEYLKKTFKDVEFKRYMLNMAYWIFRIED